MIWYESEDTMTDQIVAIEVRNVTKQFRVYRDKSHTFKDKVLSWRRNRHEAHTVLNNISFDVYRGQALGLIGHNGCGKSTTLKLLNKILYPDSGTIDIKGKISSLIELGAGFHPDMSGRENVYINASIFGLKKHEIDERMEDIIRFSELEEFIDNPVRTYSSGMYMRLAFSIAINVDADVLLVDEILAVGDANFQTKCFNKLKEIKRNGATIVIVSHSMEQIKGVCDRVLWLEKGEIQEDGDAVTVCEDYMVAMKDAAEKRKRKEKKEIGEQVAEDPNMLYPPAEVAQHVGKHARRWGNMKAHFTQVRLCDEKGNECRRFKYGDHARVSFTIDCEHECKGYVQFNLIDGEGYWISSIQSYANQETYIDFSKTHKGFVDIDALTLAEGEYVLEAIMRSPADEDIDVISHFIYFYMETPTTYGIRPAALANQWQV